MANTYLNNKVISYQEFIHTFPIRYDYLDKKEYANVNQTLNDNKKILFLPTYLQETNMQDVKYSKAKYKIILNGIFEDGRKANVILDGIEPYFEVRIPDTVDGVIKVRSNNSTKYVSQAQYIKQLRQTLNTEKTQPVKTSIIKGKPFKYYQQNLSLFLRFYYLKVYNRKEAIILARQQGYETAHDDLNNYYAVVCRDYLTSFSSWVYLCNYQERVVNCLKSENHISTYRVSINNFKAYNGKLTTKMLKDKTLSMTWDIETWSESGDTPLPEYANHKMFCIGTTFQWVNQQNPFLRVVLVDYPSDPIKNALTVVCGNEANIIRAFAYLFEKMRPEFIIGFNDSDYDWKWLIKRACKTKGLLLFVAQKLDIFVPYHQYQEDVILKYKFNKERVKIDASTYAESYALKMSGYIPIDARIVFRRLYPTAESSSLKWFLAKNKLGGKEDMPYQTMFKIYAKMNNLRHSAVNIFDEGKDIDFKFDNPPSEYAIIKQQLAQVNNYCIVDALRCHELLKIRSVIMDHREVANVSYTRLFDAFYRANGMKVRNLTIAIGQDEKLPFNIRFTNIPNDFISSGKYPGAYVFPPKKGLQISKLSIRERIRKAKLTQNSKRKAMLEWLDTTEEEIQRFYKYIRENSPTQIPTPTQNQFPQKFIDFLSEPIGRPITGLDFSSLYPSLIRCYNFSPEYCILNKKFARKVHESGQKLTRVEFEYNGRIRKAWFVWHNNKMDPNDADFQFGVYPYILNRLFNKRKGIKKEMKVYAMQKEQMETQDNEYLQQHSDEYEDICFQYNYLNSKQLALKVFMNTFYGEAGNKRSPFFVVEVAGGITSYGQRNIKMAQAFVEERDHVVYYGDTDSIYVAIAEKYFEEIDKLYYTEEIDKLTYWTKMVEITFKEIKPLNDGVNKMFFLDNQTRFLVMMFEESLYPSNFTGKKKYFGIPHEHVPNFNPKFLFVRGFDSKKRGVSNLLKKIFNELMRTACVDRENLYTMLELVLNKIDDIYTARDWQLEDFIQSDVFRPNKNNVKVHTFVKRMAEEGIEIPSNERFQYVIVKKYPYKYDHRGRKIPLQIGDKMELVDKVKDQALPVDLDHYMKGSVNGQLARLLVYHEMFHVEPQDDSAESVKLADEKIYKNSVKFVSEYASQYYSSYNTFGKVYQKVFRTANKLVGEFIKTNNALTHKLISANAPEENLEEWFVEFVDKAAIKQLANYGSEFISAELQKIAGKRKKNATTEEKAIARQKKAEKIKMLQEAYYGCQNSILFNRTKTFRQTMSILRRNFRENLDKFLKLYNKYQSSVNDVSNIFKNALSINNSLFEVTDQPVNYTLEDFQEIDINTKKQLEREAKAKANQILNDKELKKTIQEFNEIYTYMLAAYKIYRQTQSIVTELKNHRDTTASVATRPDDEYMQQVINSDIEETINNLNTKPM